MSDLQIAMNLLRRVVESMACDKERRMRGPGGWTGNADQLQTHLMGYRLACEDFKVLIKECVEAKPPVRKPDWRRDEPHVDLKKLGLE